MNPTINFGVSGIPQSTVKPNYINGLKRIHELGLDAFELAFVQFVNMSEETADAFRSELDRINKEDGKKIHISVHAPYFVNLNAAEDKKIEESIGRVVKAANRGALAGAANIVFHPGFYLKSSPEEAYEKVSASLKRMLEIYYENIDDPGKMPILRPETTGKVNQFGTVPELIRLSNDFPEVLPCVDFAHLHARSNGGVNGVEGVKEVLEEISRGLGERGIKNMHMHYSGIEYTEKGERKHLKLEESDAAYKDVLQALKSFGIEGNIICESPGMEDDALLLKNTYLSL